METALKKIREAGFKLTPQRRTILEVLRSSSKHMSAEEIHERIKKKCSHAGLATTYRTLDLFKELDLVTNINLGEEHKHYEWKRKHHYHLVCFGCGDVVEFKSNFATEIEKNVLDEHGFEITDEHVEFCGYCSRCAEGGESRWCHCRT